MTNAALLQDRLAALPRKIRIPFQDLLKMGYITDKIMETLLDASDIAEDNTKLLGFAVGYVNLRQSGVPISDVVTMARDLRRTIRLDWSIDRWRTEHNRLSRAQSLARLAEENVTYDLSSFDGLVPKRFPGYLIRTSRRLGMEGLRQNHCVASYHQQLINKYCAIASVFLEKERWTVQLHTTGRPEAPLRISQIRSAYNRQADTKTRRAVLDMFDVQPTDEEVRLTQTVNHLRRPRRHAYMMVLQRILPLLREHGVEEVTTCFDGYGDSGSVDEVKLKPTDAIALDEEVTIPVVSQELHDGEWIAVTEDSVVSLKDAIESLTYDYLEATGVDWVNNDGGFGDLVINVDRGSVYMNVNTRFTDSEQAYCEEVDIETGEQV